MTLDKEEHRTILTQLIEQSAFPGKFAEEVVILKQAVTNATIDEPREKQLRKVP
jgi:hypothetical protein